MKMNPISDEQDYAHVTSWIPHVQKSLFILVKPEIAVVLHSLGDIVLEFGRNWRCSIAISIVLL